MTNNKSVVLLVLDGWGLSPSWIGNALALDNSKYIDRLWQSFPHTTLNALGTVSRKASLADSKLGHMMIGSGRLVHTNLEKINESISSNKFFKNKVLLGAIEWAKKNNSNLHLIGMISDEGIHSHLSHLLTLLNFCERQDFKRVYVDAITDGIDSSTSSLSYIEKIEQKFQNLGFGSFSSIAGRNFAMNKTENWPVSRQYFETLTTNKSIENDIKQIIRKSYTEKITDENIVPTRLNDKNIKEGDAIILFNFRSDRSKQLAQIFLDKNFKKGLWKPKRIDDLYFAAFCAINDYSVKTVFPEKKLENTLSEVLSKANLKQLKIAETLKQQHITTFFNGNEEKFWPGEEGIFIASPKVDSFAQKPEMSAQYVANMAIKAIKQNKYDLIVINFANIDAVAHTGNLKATNKAIEIVDSLVGKITEINYQNGGHTLITSDHGIAENMAAFNSNKEIKLHHTLNPVPFIYVEPKNRKNSLMSGISNFQINLANILFTKDNLSDIAPTILEILDVPKPKEMTGKSLLKRLQ